MPEITHNDPRLLIAPEILAQFSEEDLKIYNDGLKTIMESRQAIDKIKSANKIEHFTRPNPPQKLLLDAWKNLEKRIFVFTGGNRCLGGETKIYDPIKKKSTPVSEIKEDFHVYAYDKKTDSKIIAKAEKPFKKKPDNIYRIILSNNESFTASLNHSILTDDGYRGIGSIYSQNLISEYNNTAIESLHFLRHDDIWNFTVPDYGNYYCADIIHKNSGKTSILVIINFSVMFGFWPWSGEKIEFCHNQPRKLRLIVQDWDKHGKTVIVPALKEWWPSSRKVDIKKNDRGVEAFWTDLKSGSTVELMSNKQEAKLHEGWHGDLISSDEPFTEEIYDANRRGLIDRRARVLMCGTLLIEPWIKRKLILKRDSKTGKPSMAVFSVKANMRDNIGYGLTQKGVDEYLEDYSNDPDKIRVRVDGQAAFEDNLVYSKFDRDKHIKEFKQIPLDWILDIHIDYHPAKEWAVIFLATQKQGFKIVVHEIWEKGSYKYIGEKIIRWVTNKKLRVANIIIDPLSKGDPNSDLHEKSTFDKMLKLFAPFGYTLNVRSKDKATGIDMVSDLLWTENQIAALFFDINCVHTIWEIEAYCFEENSKNPVKKDDDMMEGLYGCALLETEWEPLEDDEGYQESKPVLANNPCGY